MSYKANYDAIAWDKKRPVYKRSAQAERGGPHISKDYDGYTCPVTDKWVEGRVAHRENLKRQDCRVLEKGESRDQNKRVGESYTDGLSRILEQR